MSYLANVLYIFSSQTWCLPKWVHPTPKAVKVLLSSLWDQDSTVCIVQALL